MLCVPATKGICGKTPRLLPSPQNGVDAQDRQRERADLHAAAGAYKGSSPKHAAPLNTRIMVINRLRSVNDAVSTTQRLPCHALWQKAIRPLSSQAPRSGPGSSNALSGGSAQGCFTNSRL